MLVALGALRLGTVLRAAGGEVSLELLACAGLLHDIARTRRDHAAIGANMVLAQGWTDCGNVVGAHTTLPGDILASLGISREDTPVGGRVAAEPVPGRVLQPTLPAAIDSERSLPTENGASSSGIAHACALVYLSDKFFFGESRVALDERFAAVRKRFAHDREALAAIDHRRETALAVRDWFLRFAGGTPEAVLDVPCGHPLELFLVAALERGSS